MKVGANANYIIIIGYCKETMNLLNMSFSKFSKFIYKSFHCFKIVITSIFTLFLKVQMLMKLFHILDIYRVRYYI